MHCLLPTVEKKTNVESRVEIRTLYSTVAIASRSISLPFQLLLKFQARGSFGEPNAIEQVRRNKMKIFQKLTVLISTLFLISAIPAMAQIQNQLNFDAPFAFYAGNVELPAGSYTVSQPSENDKLLLIQSTDKSHSAFVQYVPSQSNALASDTNVAFDKYGETEFLSQISLQGQTYGMEIPVTKGEQNEAEAAAAAENSTRSGQ
jgi:hypothetical protein